jgi:hypothetical protein
MQPLCFLKSRKNVLKGARRKEKEQNMKIFMSFADLAINPDTGSPNIYALLGEGQFETLEDEEIVSWDANLETIELVLQNLRGSLKHEAFEYYRVVPESGIEMVESKFTDQCYSEGQMAGFKDFMVDICNQIELERTFLDAYNSLEDEVHRKVIDVAWNFYIGKK